MVVICVAVVIVVVIQMPVLVHVLVHAVVVLASESSHDPRVSVDCVDRKRMRLLFTCWCRVLSVLLQFSITILLSLLYGLRHILSN